MQSEGHIGVIQRAFQMAKESKCRCVSEITIALRKEGYESAGSHLAGRTINRQLKAAIEKASMPQM